MHFLNEITPTEKNINDYYYTNFEREVFVVLSMYTLRILMEEQKEKTAINENIFI